MNVSFWNKSLRRTAWLAVVFCLLNAAIGCGYFRDLNTFEYLEHGYTFVLPGIEGESLFNSNVAQGLSNGGVETAIEVHDWTTGTWLLFPVHLRAIERNRREVFPNRFGHAMVLANKLAPGLVDFFMKRLVRKK